MESEICLKEILDWFTHRFNVVVDVYVMKSTKYIELNVILIRGVYSYILVIKSTILEQLRISS